MELGVYVVLGVAVIVAVAAFARKLGIAAPIILVVVGVGLSYLPGMPDLQVSPQLILEGVLPPVLYAAALNVPLTDIRRNLAPITSLSVVLVAVTAFGSGLLLFELLPDLNLAAGIALGAIIAPPDAVAATSIGRRLGLPPRLLTLLEGEGLVNDATALVLLRSATAAAAGALASPWAGVLDFLYAVVVALVIGVAAGIATVWVRAKLTEATLDTALSLVVPFVAFMPAEALHASGVLAVVVAGLYTGSYGPRHLTPQARISERINWSTVQFLLENAVFLVIGLEIRPLIADVDGQPLGVWESVGIGLLAVLALMVIRFVWIGPLVYGLRRRAEHDERRMLRQWLFISYYRTHPVESRRQARRKAYLERRYPRRRADLDEVRDNRIDWRGGVALGWSGMRGVVTLAAAQSLPRADYISYRPQLILIAFTVAVVSLVLQGGTLPWLIRALRLTSGDTETERRQLAELLDTISDAGLNALDDPARVPAEVEGADPEVFERVRRASNLRAEAAWERAETRDAPLIEQPHRLFNRLRLLVVQAEREKLIEEQRLGSYPTRVLAQAQALLDLEETRLDPLRAAQSRPPAPLASASDPSAPARSRATRPPRRPRL
ncbi:cation:proton antiporter [Gryllotalpicola ginsengisoli]|uniref:cation:proton antiporter n=1 Tax=Gryllotalpicola ginsengisoli TaxID=444608 RepID=UPI0003B64713|nr:sodium:proton antiporter [Gryllotalpicola ginsengisoli]